MLKAGRLAPALPGCQRSFHAGCRLPRQTHHPSAPARRPRDAQRRGFPATPVTAAAATAVAALLTPQAVFDAATVFVMPFYALMIVAPRKRFAQKILESKAPHIAAGCLYGLLLWAWNPLPHIAAAAQAAMGAVSSGAVFRLALPNLTDFAAIFGTGEMTAVAWLHLVLLDLFLARWVYQDGMRNDVPIWHSAILCFMVGPLGLLSHLVTKQLATKRRYPVEQADHILYRF